MTQSSRRWASIATRRPVSNGSANACSRRSATSCPRTSLCFTSSPPDLDAVKAALSPITGQTTSFEIEVGEAFSLSGGVAFKVHNAALGTLRKRLAEPFLDELSNQDRSGFRGHITVQNKVKKRRAQKTLSVLKSADMPDRVRAEAVELWFYRGGPWEEAGRLVLGW